MSYGEFPECPRPHPGKVETGILLFGDFHVRYVAGDVLRETNRRMIHHSDDGHVDVDGEARRDDAPDAGQHSQQPSLLHTYSHL